MNWRLRLPRVVRKWCLIASVTRIGVLDGYRSRKYVVAHHGDPDYAYPDPDRRLLLGRVRDASARWGFPWPDDEATA